MVTPKLKLRFKFRFKFNFKLIFEFKLVISNETNGSPYTWNNDKKKYIYYERNNNSQKPIRQLLLLINWLVSIWSTRIQTPWNPRYSSIGGSSRPEVLCKKGVLWNFPKPTGKRLCQSPFFNNVVGLGTGVFLWILRNF